MRVVIVDDEELARARLRRLLSSRRDVEIVAELGDGAEAVARLGELAPDVVLLDVRMPQRDGFEVLATIDGAARCAVIFVTAYDAYAVRAFTAGAADYLLKPVDGERLGLALDRARQRLEHGAGATGLADVVAALRADVAPRRIAVRDGARFVFVPIADIDAAIADRNYVELRAQGRTYTTRATLAAVEADLDPAAFVRVHRSVILRIARITAIEPLFRGEYMISLSDGTTYTSARSQRAALRRALGLP